MAISKPTKPNTFSTGLAYSADVNEDFDIIYAKTDELIDAVNNAAASKPTLASRLSVSMNDDGTMKAGITAGGEWLNSAFTILYVGATTFTVAGNQVAIFSQYRRIRVTLAASTVYSEVVSSEYSAVSGLTTVVLADAVLTDPITSIEHATISPLAANGSVSPATIAAATAAQGATADAALPAASYTAADVLAKLLTVDGPTSGISAQVSADAAAHIALTTAHGAVSTATGSKMVVRDVNGRAKFAEGAATGDAVVFSQFATNFGASGYQKLPGGLILQWGTGDVGAHTFPMAFPNGLLHVTPTARSANNIITVMTATSPAPAVTGFTSFGYNHTAAGVYSGTVYYFAIGY